MDGASRGILFFSVNIQVLSPGEWMQVVIQKIDGGIAQCKERAESLYFLSYQPLSEVIYNRP
jgi:hypothetical protein